MEIWQLVLWCTDTNLIINTKKTNELIADFRKIKYGAQSPICINCAEDEPIAMFKYLCTSVSLIPLLDSLHFKFGQEGSSVSALLEEDQKGSSTYLHFYRSTIERILGSS